ncbi:MAG: hypothetical protein M3128_09865 [Verrucomicrobiota bacterium]|nr:hypothetical protein [Verrucomicrobiota bacterium]
MQRIAFYSFLLLLLQLPVTETRAQDAIATPTPSAPLFEERPYGPRPLETPTPMRKIKEPDKPIPVGWIIGGAAIIAIGTTVFLWGSARQWHSSNLFDRQYRFPRSTKVAVRFGAKRCGGHVATVRLGPSKTKNS